MRAIVLLDVSVVSLAVIAAWFSTRRRRGAPLPPGPRKYWMIGNILQMPGPKQYAAFTFERWRKLYGNQRPYQKLPLEYSISMQETWFISKGSVTRS
jgi:hypothetical protein